MATPTPSILFPLKQRCVRVQFDLSDSLITTAPELLIPWFWRFKCASKEFERRVCANAAAPASQILSLLKSIPLNKKNGSKGSYPGKSQCPQSKKVRVRLNSKAFARATAPGSPISLWLRSKYFSAQLDCKACARSSARELSIVFPFKLK